MQGFFYSKNEQGKLIQNIVFEYVEGNLEDLIGKTIKEKKTIPDSTIKVTLLLLSITSDNSSMDSKEFILRISLIGILSQKMFSCQKKELSKYVILGVVKSSIRREKIPRILSQDITGLQN